MSDGPLTRRSWRSLTNATPALRTSTGVRAREGYTLRQRFWASFIGADLPAGNLLTESVARERSAEYPTVSAREQPRTSGPGWFPLPLLPSGAGLAAAGSDTVLLEARSPDGKVQFLVRGQGDSGAGYSLELVVRDLDGAELLMTTVRYSEGGGEGPERALLVPVLRARFGPAASYVRLPGFTGEGWGASAPIPVRAADVWDVAAVTLSVRSALNDATRDAWREVRALISDAGLRGVIDEELR